jgi:hypothetical protein
MWISHYAAMEVWGRQNEEYLIMWGISNDSERYSGVCGRLPDPDVANLPIVR